MEKTFIDYYLLGDYSKIIHYQRIEGKLSIPLKFITKVYIIWNVQKYKD